MLELARSISHVAALEAELAETNAWRLSRMAKSASRVSAPSTVTARNNWWLRVIELANSDVATSGTETAGLDRRHLK